ncbi:MAG: Mur ligase family protein, partial [Actinomycetota bacterium]|nr:Mur ligase family protein [Actinomycetota bacterium]
MTVTASTIDRLAAAAGDLLRGIRGERGGAVRGLAYDSRHVTAGDLFFCIPGAVTDGHRFATEAAGAGAAALCVERPTGTGLPEIEVTDVRRAMGRIAAAYHGTPAADLMMVGVTGTNGKTTTAYLLESILGAAGHTTGLIGTIETRIGGEGHPGVRTTPESVDLQALLAEMRDRGVGAVAMEVTSHALVLHRVEGIRYLAAAFTNLTQDHLDFHSGMEDYFEAKRSLFTVERVEHGTVNIDDPYGRKLFEDATVPLLG